MKVYGLPLRKDAFFVANHLSWHDIPILAGITGTAFVAQDGVRAYISLIRLIRRRWLTGKRFVRKRAIA